MNYTKISKMISYALRHKPEEFNLTLDKEGWVNTDKLINRINEKLGHINISKEDVVYINENSTKKRFQIKGDKIRAYYGHSIKEKIKLEEAKPPEYLYHGTPRRYVDFILDKGLISKSRQYVHLSTDINTAKIVGGRRDDKPTILIVESRKAWEDGMKFYHGNEDVWLAENIHSRYIKVLEG